MKIIVHHAVEFDPHRKSFAGVFARTFRRALCKAGDGGESPLRQLQYLAYVVFRRLAGKRVSAALAAAAFYKIAADEILYYNFKIFFLYLLTLRHVLEGNGNPAVLRDIYHHAQGVTPFCGNHFSHRLFFCILYHGVNR